ncbi:SusE domain-containing protein [Ancylomarina sp. 16SWW S1-10-2]|uniref:SusE domain-containing protein n=1 Tax=Ancylomarina sp. 16SWW S1-10-2 TaxID=2499681 RepID=UPI0012AD8F71|nr:SusE domain-containing protein [Ancylomarina sp. 16SWW S1-10-2]MRT93680.1 hypothetical protein [Ancylomarina sp. 16SWW S1-10-2]
MKNIKYIFILLLAVSFFSCDDDDDVKLDETEYTAASDIAGFGETLAISKATKTETIDISYTPAYYGVDLVVTHKLQFSTTAEFSNSVTFDVDAADNTFSFTVGALNELLTEKLLLPVDEEATVYARIVTSSLDGVETLYSSVIDFNTTPYLDILFAPETFYLFGDGVGRVAQNNKLKFIKVHSEDVVWTTVWMEATGSFKLCSDADYKGVIGRIGEAISGEYTLGTADDRGIDIPVPGTAGYYTIGIDLANNKMIIEAANIYVCGPTIGEVWPTESVVDENKFLLDADNKTMYLTKEFAAGELRLHITHPYISATDWWHAEFIFLDGVIEYRADGDDQERFSMGAGEQTIVLDFINQTGKIE